MPLRTARILLRGTRCGANPHSKCITSCLGPLPPRSTSAHTAAAPRGQGQDTSTTRNYATASYQGQDSSQTGPGTGISLEWPTAAHPTPYQIFNQHRDAPYSKSRFYELVKLYHPDLHHHPPPSCVAGGLSAAVRLERYRLVVAANDILSDPTKRRAYDLFGIGWAGPHSDGEHRWSRAAEKSWRSEPGSPAMNATWEDWERWYQQQRGGDPNERQSPVFMSNGGFVGVILLFVLVGSWGQTRRMESHSQRVVEMVDHRHDNISQEMRRRSNSSAALSKEERIENFLMQREGWGYGERPTTHRSISRGAGSSDRG